MKKLHLASLLAAACVAAPFAAHADNTIEFNGELLDVTCTTAAGTNGDQTINLPSLAVSTFDGTTTSGTLASFDIVITGCGNNVSSVTPVFGNVVGAPANGANMVNTAQTSPATGVELQMMNNGTSSNPVYLNATAQNVDPAAITAGSATSKFAVRYVSTGTVTAGAFKSAVVYALTYN